MSFSCQPDTSEIRQRMMDELVEKLISEKLMIGWTICQPDKNNSSTSCPECHTPLMVNNTVCEMAPDGVVVAQPTEYSARAIARDEEVAYDLYSKSNGVGPNHALEAANNETVAGVPFCVYCKCHVVTQVSQLSLLEAFDRMADRSFRGNLKFDLPPGTEIPQPDEIESCGPPLEVNSLVAMDVPSNEGDDVSSQHPLESSSVLTSGLQFLAGSSKAAVNSPTKSQVGVETVLDETIGEGNNDIVVEDNISNIEDPEMSESIVEEYNVRRDIATKVLGAKMLQGFILKEEQCSKCKMPMMEHDGSLECVVCPILIKRAKKKKVEEEAAQIDKLREEAVAAERILQGQVSELNIKSKEEGDENAAALLKAKEDATVAARELVLLAELRAVKAARKEQEERIARTEEAVLNDEVKMDHWAVLREDASNQLSRRLLQGWSMSSETCKGSECDSAPLMLSGGKAFCVVCGGTGTGEDGAYLSFKSCAPVTENITPTTTVEKMKEKEPEEIKRQETIAGIGKKLLLGFTIANQTCERCEVPLMTSPEGTLECVTCGPYKENPTKKIGNLILQGWVPMSNKKTCIICTLPLLLNPVTKEPECCTCGSVKRTLTVQEKDTATAEIGRRVMSGWILVPGGAKCYYCGFALCQEPKSTPECVLCGPVDEQDEMKGTAVPEMHPTTPNRGIMAGGYHSQTQSHAVPFYTQQIPQGYTQSPVPPYPQSAPYSPYGGNDSFAEPYADPVYQQQQQYVGNYNRPPRSMRPPRVVSKGNSYNSRNGYSGDEVSLLNDDISVAKTVASDALGAILGRMERAKAQLLQSTSQGEQEEIVKLIEKLASAAVAVKGLEDNLE